MGKYIRKKSKIESTIALMDVSPSSSSLGVLTRAQSLALQQRHLQKPSSSSSPPNPPPRQNKKQKQKQKNSTDYLQLRSRRLQKKPPIVLIRSTKRTRKQTCGLNPNPNPQNFDSSSVPGSRSDSISESSVFAKDKDFNCEINKDTNFELQPSESFNRTTRESTPSSLVRKPEAITSPGSSTKRNNCVSDNINQGEESLFGSRRHRPTTPEMDEFFSGAEEEQQKQFIEKYNFDPVNEQPLPGRFEWEKVDD